MRISDWSSDVCSSDLIVINIKTAKQDKAYECNLAKFTCDPRRPAPDGPVLDRGRCVHGYLRLGGRVRAVVEVPHPATDCLHLRRGIPLDAFAGPTVFHRAWASRPAAGKRMVRPVDRQSTRLNSSP